MTPGAAGQQVTIAAFWFKKKAALEKEGVIHRHATAVTETAARICINQGGFAFETVSENTHLQPRWVKMRAAPVSFLHPPPQVFNQIIHKLYK